jgi:hypothetical protein
MALRLRKWTSRLVVSATLAVAGVGLAGGFGGGGGGFGGGRGGFGGGNGGGRNFNIRQMLL